MTDAMLYARLSAIVCAALAVSYGLARSGEPQSAWLWCTVLGACP